MIDYIWYMAGLVALACIVEYYAKAFDGAGRLTRLMMWGGLVSRPIILITSGVMVLTLILEFLRILGADCTC